MTIIKLFSYQSEWFALHTLTLFKLNLHVDVKLNAISGSRTEIMMVSGDNLPSLIDKSLVH